MTMLLKVSQGFVDVYKHGYVANIGLYSSIY